MHLQAAKITCCNLCKSSGREIPFLLCFEKHSTCFIEFISDNKQIMYLPSKMLFSMLPNLDTIQYAVTLLLLIAGNNVLALSMAITVSRLPVMGELLRKKATCLLVSGRQSGGAVDGQRSLRKVCVSTFLQSACLYRLYLYCFESLASWASFQLPFADNLNHEDKANRRHIPHYQE